MLSLKRVGEVLGVFVEGIGMLVGFFLWWFRESDGILLFVRDWERFDLIVLFDCNMFWRCVCDVDVVRWVDRVGLWLIDVFLCIFLELRFDGLLEGEFGFWMVG